MLQIPNFIIVTLVIFLPCFRSQCVNCSEHWNARCDTNVVGYYCARGASVYERLLTPSEYVTSTIDPRNMYASCVPYPYELDYVRNYCCFWSRKLGCMLTLHPEKYDYGNPKRLCENCRNRCQCDHSVDLKSFNSLITCCLAIMLLQFL